MDLFFRQAIKKENENYFCFSTLVCDRFSTLVWDRFNALTL
jgi:hypothetical protein